MNREATSSRQSMRAFLSALRGAGDLAPISQPVNLDYEIAAYLVARDSGPALHFAHVNGPADSRLMPIVGNLLNALPRFALGLGGKSDALQARLVAAIEKPLPPPGGPA